MSGFQTRVGPLANKTRMHGWEIIAQFTSNYPYYWLSFFPLILIFRISTLILVASSFLLGLLLREAAVESGFKLVEKHYQERILSKANLSKSTILPALIPQTIEDLSANLDRALDQFVGFIVRDFIGMWYIKVNRSQSTEFPNSVHISLKEVFLTLGRSGSLINPTDFMLSSVRAVITHVKEFREFDLKGLDMKVW
jgi:hypothetical protein